MNTQDKSLKLAELMKWEVEDFPSLIGRGSSPLIASHEFKGEWVRIYPDDSDNHDDKILSLAQFAAILLKFPEVMARIVNYEESLWEWYPSADANGHLEPTQANILDEILRMNGVDV